MISIIIPTLNEETVIAKTLGALKKLHAFDYEIIVSDGNSTDKTAQIARQYADYVLVYKGKERQTIGGARNSGAKIAKGNYLVFLDADCIIPDPDKFFTKAINIFERDSEIVGIVVSLRVLKEYETISDHLIFGFMNFGHVVTNNILGWGSGAGEFQMIRKDVFDALDGYNEKFAAVEDNEMFARLSKVGKTRMVRTLTVFHTGRRAHKIGWPRLLGLWFLNGISSMFFKRSFSKEWKVIR